MIQTWKSLLFFHNLYCNKTFDQIFVPKFTNDRFFRSFIGNVLKCFLHVPIKEKYWKVHLTFFNPILNVLGGGALVYAPSPAMSFALS